MGVQTAIAASRGPADGATNGATNELPGRPQLSNVMVPGRDGGRGQSAPRQ